MLRRILAVSCLALFVAQAPAAAQPTTDLCDPFRQSQVGQWVLYRMSGGSTDAESVRIAVVGEEEKNGETLQWIEMKMTGGSTPLITQVLVPRIGFSPEQIQGMVMKVGDQPAMKAPESMLGFMRDMASQGKIMDFAAECEASEVVGTEDVTVPAGTYRATHLRSPNGEAWVTKEVPFGFVKGRSDDGTGMALAGHGTDATSSITETPQEMPGMGMRP
ncbi:MAG: hypothetical protein ACE5JR_04495 [Gemmatimonadota bacterium]